MHNLKFLPSKGIGQQFWLMNAHTNCCSRTNFGPSTIQLKCWTFEFSFQWCISVEAIPFKNPAIHWNDRTEWAQWLQMNHVDCFFYPEELRDWQIDSSKIFNLRANSFSLLVVWPPLRFGFDEKILTRSDAYAKHWEDDNTLLIFNLFLTTKEVTIKQNVPNVKPTSKTPKQKNKLKKISQMIRGTHRIILILFQCFLLLLCRSKSQSGIIWSCRISWRLWLRAFRSCSRKLAEHLKTRKKSSDR